MQKFVSKCFPSDKESSKEGGSSKGDSESDKTPTKSKTENVVKEEKVEKKFVPPTNNDVRQKCRDMIKNSLMSAESEDCKGMKSMPAGV